jgi:hypothetical protein
MSAWAGDENGPRSCGGGRGFVANIYFYDIETPLKEFVVSRDALVQHCRTIHAAVSMREWKPRADAAKHRRLELLLEE